MVELTDYLTDVFGISRDPAPAFPGTLNHALHVAEHRKQNEIELNSIPEFCFELLNAYVGNISPDAQDIGEIMDCDLVQRLAPENTGRYGPDN